MSANTLLLLKNRTTPVDPYHETASSSGLAPVFIPLLDHIHMDKAEIALFLQSDTFTKDTSSFIITSQRAVEVLNETMALIEDSSARDTIFSKPAYTVGPATSKILSDAGFLDIRGGADAGNGTILSDIIIHDKFHEGKMDKQIMFFTGEIRKDIIPRKLLTAQFNLVEKVIYKTAPKDNIIERFLSAADSCTSDNSWIVFFSPQGTEEIVQHIRGDNTVLKKFKIASIGPTTEAYLIENGIVPSIVSEKPDAHSLTSSILSFSI